MLRKSVDGLRAFVIINGLTKWGTHLNPSHTVYITYQGKSKLTTTKKQGNGNATLNHSAVMPQKDNKR